MRHRARFRVLNTHRLHEVITGVHGHPALDRTVQAVAETIVKAAGFQIAVVSVVRPGAMMETVAVAGNEDARNQLLGARKPRAHYEEEFAVAEQWGNLLFVPHQRLPGAAERGWVPDIPARKQRRAWHPLDALYAPLRAPSGELVGVLSVDLPISGKWPERRQRELLEILALQAGIAIDNGRLAEQLRAREELFRLAFDAAGTGMALVSLADADFGKYLRVNPTFCSIVGYSAEKILSMTVAELTHPDDRAEDQILLLDLSAGRRSGYKREKRYICADGQAVWVSLTVTYVVSPAGSLRYAIAQVEDITGRRAEQQDLQHRAQHDSLTDLPNRAALLLRLGLAMEIAHETGRPGTVLFVDLDDFKQVNDRYGHLIGDQAIAVVAARLSASVRPGDMAARLGGDEFVVVADGLDDDAVTRMTRRLSHSIAVPIALPDATIVITASIGTTAIPTEDADPIQLLRAADQAMYAAKRGLVP